MFAGKPNFKNSLVLNIRVFLHRGDSEDFADFVKPFISSVIIGANKMAQLEDNLGADELNLSTHEVEKLDSLTAPQPIYPGWMQAMGWDAKVKAALDS